MIDQSKYRELLERARKRFQLAVDAERTIREEALIDLEFLAGDQWDDKVQADRERGPSPRPCLVFNKCLPPVTQLCNQGRQNKPAIQVSPVDSAGDVDTAKVLGGLIRHIEYDSDADQAYDTALFYAAGCGFGYWMYGSRFARKSFNQEIEYITVTDPFSIYLDCYARKPDRSDMKWAFVIDKMAGDAFCARYGEDESDLALGNVGELQQEGWFDDDARRVAEYWEVDSEEKTLRCRKHPDGITEEVYLEDLTAPAEDDPEATRPLTPEEIDGMDWVLDETGKPLERKEELPCVMQYIINGARVLEEPTHWDGETIPIVMVTGLEMTVRGQKKIFSMTRFARDPQQLLNFYKTMEAESIALAPKPKFVGAVGQFKTKRRDWQRANLDNAAYLEYDLMAVGDKMAPEPQWRVFDPPVQALSIGAAAAADDIKSSTGYFDPSLGNPKEALSGVAVGKLQKQGDVSNFHFFDNQARAIKRGGRILVDVIPKKYDTAREVRIIGEDQKERVLKVNQPGVDDQGKPYHYILDAGKYDVRVQEGPSYSTQRAETRELIMTLAQGNPEVWQLAGDIFFENQDFLGADRLAKRFKKALPPALQDDDAQQNIPPQVQAQIQQMQQALQMSNQQIAALTELLKTKILDLQSKERQTTQTNQTKMYVAEAASKAAAMNALATRDHDARQADLDRRAQLLNAGLGVQADAFADEQEYQRERQQLQQQQAHEAAMAGQQHAGDMQLQDAAHQHQAAMAQQPPPSQPQPDQPQA